jgi:asparagine synthase (glutamine-hydrolysing)
MNEVTKHRGPDGTAIKILKGDTSNRGVTFGHNRLAIIDPDPRSNQPMTDASGRYTVVFNGEIYNFKDIRKELAYPWRTESDTEVVLAGYAQWGKEVFNRLNGPYALAIHDRDTGEIVLARDPMGINPLYVAETPKGYAFSSEIKGLLECGIPRVVDRDAFALYVRTLYVPGPRTMFAGVEKFPQGKVGIIKNGSIVYSDILYKARSAPLDWRDRAGLKTAVTEAVTRQLLSDRPLGIYLSGGIDSTAVLASAMTARTEMDTFSVSFALGEGEEAGKFNADADIARRSAKHFGATHHDFVVNPEEAFGLLESAAYYLDEPIGNATSAAQFALSKFAREKLVVALTGDGGDELFGGYPRYRFSRLMDFYQAWMPFRLSSLFPFERLKKLETESLADRFALFHFQKDAEIADLLTQKPSVSYMIHSTETQNLMEMDRATWLIDEALLRTNKLSMAHAVEPRPPLLDLELVAATRDFPLDKQVSYFDTKILLKRAMKGTLPEWILNQPKRGWFSPGSKWLRHPVFGAEVDKALSPEFAPATSGLFNWDGVKKALAEHRSRAQYRAPALIALLMFQLWSKRFGVEV